MNIKKIISIILGVFVLSSVIYLIASEINQSNEPKVSTSEQVDPFRAEPTLEQNDQDANLGLNKEKVIHGYYFHGSNRCYTCNLMESYIRDVLQESFSKETKEGLITFKTINVEEERNRQYIMRYQLQSISFFLSLYKKGEEVDFKNIDQIWMLARNENQFKDYIKTEIQKFLEK